jgi:hypothetical protein
MPRRAAGYCLTRSRPRHQARRPPPDRRHAVLYCVRTVPAARSTDPRSPDARPHRRTPDAVDRRLLVRDIPEIGR